MHNHLAEKRGGRSQRRGGAGDDTTEPLERLGGGCASVLGQPPFVVQFEVESCAQDTGEPAQGADARGGREVGDHLLDNPPPAQ